MSNSLSLQQAVAHIEQLLAAGYLEHADAACRELAQQAPDRPEPWLLLGIAALHTRRLPEAEAAFREAIARAPDQAGYWHNLSIALREQGRPAEAEACSRRAVALDANNPAFWLNLGNSLHNLSRWQEAAEAFRRSLAIDPGNPVAWSNLGATEERLQRPDAAAQAYERSLSLAPGDVVAVSNYGLLLAARGQPERARELLQRVLSVHHGSPDAWAALGIACKLLGETTQAKAALQRALELAPHHREARYNLAQTLMMERLPADAEACIRPLLADERNGEAWSLLGAVQLIQCRQEEGLAAMRRANQIEPHPDRHSMLLLGLNYPDDAEPRALLAEHLQWDAIYAQAITAASRPPPRRHTTGPLRLGFVSADFGQHPTGFLVLPAVEHLDRSQCFVACYCDRSSEDAYTARFRAAADLWRPVCGQAHEELAEQIRRDEIDVLIDLAGHSGKRLLTFARRPAPLQVTWFGYPGTTGMAAMDCLIADRFHIRPGEESGYRETVLRLPGGYACYGPPPDAPQVQPLPALSAEHVTFGSFNNPAKFSASILSAWAEVLRRVPGSVLLLKYDALEQPVIQQRLRQRFAELGVDPDRIRAEGHSDLREHMAAYGRVDIALDTQPYSGGLTTCDALWMGVPVVTFPGRIFASRHTQSHLTSAGCEQFVAADIRGYVELAVDWAGRIEELAELRQQLRERVRRSPLCDASTFARDLLALLQQAWSRPG